MSWFFLSGQRWKSLQIPFLSVVHFLSFMNIELKRNKFCMTKFISIEVMPSPSFKLSKRKGRPLPAIWKLSAGHKDSQWFLPSLDANNILLVTCREEISTCTQRDFLLLLWQVTLPTLGTVLSEKSPSINSLHTLEGNNWSAYLAQVCFLHDSLIGNLGWLIPSTTMLAINLFL